MGKEHNQEGNGVYLFLILAAIASVSYLIFKASDKSPKPKVEVKHFDHYEYDPTSDSCFAVEGVGSFQTRSTISCDNIRHMISE